MASQETMDFIQALKKALELGVTKEEFLRVWNAEVKLKNGQEKPVASRSSQILEQQIGGQNFKDGQLTTQWQHAREELIHDLDTKLQQMFHQFTSEQEKQWQKVYSKNSQTEEQFQKQIETLCKHISVTAELQGSSLKEYFNQQIDLLGEQFRKISHDHCLKHPAEPAPFKQSDVERHQNGSSEICSKQKTSINLLASKVNQKSMYNEYLPDNMGNLDQNTSHISEVDICFDEYHTLGCEIGHTHSELLERDSSRPTHAEPTMKNRSSASKQEIDSNVDPVLSQPGLPLKEESIAATGFYAEAISDQMKPNSSRHINSSNIQAFKSVIYETNIPISVSSKRKQTNEFTIPDIENFSVSGTSYLSPFIFSQTKSWKAQICVSFNNSHKLEVQVLISPGINNNNEKWPLKFTGLGSIYQSMSKKFTQIWQISSVKCDNPNKTKETSLPAKICLTTKRGSYPDVTYEELKYRHFTENNELIFEWNLNARA